MDIFHGIACFSPSVSSIIKELWATHGGTVAKTLKEKLSSEWFFCDGSDDPWLTELLKEPIIIFHADWVLATCSTKSTLPLAGYVLDTPASRYKKRSLVKEFSGSWPIAPNPEVTFIAPSINQATDNIKSGKTGDHTTLYKRVQTVAASNGQSVRDSKKPSKRARLQLDDHEHHSYLRQNTHGESGRQKSLNTERKTPENLSAFTQDNHADRSSSSFSSSNHEGPISTVYYSCVSSMSESLPVANRATTPPQSITHLDLAKAHTDTKLLLKRPPALLLTPITSPTSEYSSVSFSAKPNPWPTLIGKMSTDKGVFSATETPSVLVTEALSVLRLPDNDIDKTTILTLGTEHFGKKFQTAEDADRRKTI